MEPTSPALLHLQQISGVEKAQLSWGLARREGRALLLLGERPDCSRETETACWLDEPLNGWDDWILGDRPRDRLFEE